MVSRIPDKKGFTEHMTEGRDQQTMHKTCSSLPLVEVFFLSFLTGIIFHLCAAQILQGTVDSRHWACVGNAGSYEQMDANCTSGQVIAVTAVQVGAKPNELACPKTVNSSTMFDPDTCCQPNQTNDCIIDYPIPTLRSICSGQAQCLSSPAESMSFNDTTCNTTVYGTKTSYMSLEYKCIEGTRVSEMCTAVSLSTTSSIYLWNRNYGTTPPVNNTIQASDTSCACSVETESCAASIFVYSVHMDLSQINGTCQQELKFTDETGASIFNTSCSSYQLGLLFTISSNYLHVKLENTLGRNDGRFWLGFQASDSSSGIHLNCPAVNRSYCIHTSMTTEQPVSTYESVSISDMPTTTKVKETNSIDKTAVAAITTFPATGVSTVQSSSVSPVVTGTRNNNPGLNKWMILLIALAATVLFLLLVIVIVCLVCCKSETERRKRVITLKRRDVEKAQKQKSRSVHDEQRSSVGSATDLQRQLAHEYDKEPEFTTRNGPSSPYATAAPVMCPNNSLQLLEKTTPVVECLNPHMSNRKGSLESRTSLDGSQLQRAYVPQTKKESDRKKSKQKKKHRPQDAHEEKVNDRTVHPPSGFLRAKIVIEGDFPLPAPDNGRSRSLSRKKKKKKHKRVKASELMPASGMHIYDDKSLERSKRSLKEKTDSQKIVRHPLKSKVAPEMSKKQQNDVEINNANYSNINDRDTPESTDVEINNGNYSNIDGRHASRSSERKQTDVEISYGNQSFVHDMKDRRSTKRQRHDIEISNGNDSDIINKDECHG